jgi:hypothetical protein
VTGYLYLLPQGDDCRDAGGRAMPGAIAEGRVRGVDLDSLIPTFSLREKE